MTTTVKPTPPAAAPPWDGAIFDGTFRSAASSITVTAPATGQVIGRVGHATTSDLDVPSGRRGPHNVSGPHCRTSPGSPSC